jgi:hypothetical protein
MARRKEGRRTLIRSEQETETEALHSQGTFPRVNVSLKVSLSSAMLRSVCQRERVHYVSRQDSLLETPAAVYRSEIEKRFFAIAESTTPSGGIYRAEVARMMNHD